MGSPQKGVIMGLFDAFKKKKTQEPPKVEPPAPVIPEYKHVGSLARMDDWYLMYRYQKVPFERANKTVYYEGEAEVDAAGSVSQDGTVIGTITDTAKIKMIADFIGRDEKFVCKIDGTDTVYLGFYKELYKSLANCPHALYKITKTSKKDEIMECPRSEFIEMMDQGDLITLEYNDETDTYLLTDVIGSELGELSKSDSKKLMQQEDDGCQLYAFLAETEEDDNFRPIFRVEIFCK